IRYWSVTGVQTCALPICLRVRGCAGRSSRVRREASAALDWALIRRPALSRARDRMAAVGAEPVGLGTPTVEQDLPRLDAPDRQRSEERRVGKGGRYQWSA